MRVRRAEGRDHRSLVEGNVAMARETEDLELERSVVEMGVQAALQDESKGRYYVVEVDGRVVGQLCITWEWSDWRNGWVWWIQSVYVWPEVRRRGVYRGLYDHVKEVAVREGAAGIRLYVDLRNEAAQKVYGRLGMDGDHYRLFEEMLAPGDG